jgi:Fur family ferric uptake transcriptional regulator
VVINSSSFGISGSSFSHETKKKKPRKRIESNFIVFISDFFNFVQQCCKYSYFHKRNSVANCFQMEKKKLNTKVQIRELIHRSGVALSHQEISRQMGYSCDRVTIYRVLDKLMEEGFIHRIIDMDGVSKFATCHGCTKEHHHRHVHFSCSVCHSVTCIEEIEPHFQLPQGYRIQEMNITLSGVCPGCSAL